MPNFTIVLWTLWLGLNVWIGAKRTSKTTLEAVYKFVEWIFWSVLAISWLEAKLP